MLLFLTYLDMHVRLCALVDCLINLGIAAYDYLCLLVSYSLLVLAHPRYCRVEIEIFGIALWLTGRSQTRSQKNLSLTSSH